MNWQVWRRIITASVATIAVLCIGGVTVLALGVLDGTPTVTATVAFAVPTMSEPVSLVLFGATLWGLASFRRRAPKSA